MTLTPPQLAMYDHVRDMISEGVVTPSVREIGDSLGYSSTSAVKRTLDILVEKGLLVRTKDKVRNLALPDAGSDLTRVATGALQAELERRGRPFQRPRRISERTATKPCGVAGCTERVGRGKLLCLNHWSTLPIGLRRELIEAFRAGREAAYQDAWRRAADYLARVS
jgi:hypothetical protein